MKSMYSWPSSSMRVEPVPRAIASPAMRAKDWLPGATYRRSWATMRCDRGPTSRIIGAGAARPAHSVGGVPWVRRGPVLLSPSPRRSVQEPERQVGGDARCRLVAVEREARPGVHVQQDGVARGRDDHVAAVDLEPERRGRAAHEARQAPLVERMASQALLLVIEPAEPRRRAVRATADADAVKLDEIALHVRLEDRTRDGPSREQGERL